MGKKLVGKINDENMSMYIQWSATLSTVWSCNLKRNIASIEICTQAPGQTAYGWFGSLAAFLSSVQNNSHKMNYFI